MTYRLRHCLTAAIAACGLLTLFSAAIENVPVQAVGRLLAPGNPTLSPPANAHAVPRSSAVAITYDADIDAATVTTQTFAVHAMQTGQVLEAYAINGGEIKVTPMQPFHPGELVQVSATTGTLSLDSSAPLAPTVWQFRAGVRASEGVFTDSGQTFPVTTTRGLDVGDLDGDGDLDVIFARHDESAYNEVWLNEGGVLTLTQQLTSLGGRAVSLGDLDGDGDLDAFFSNSAHPSHPNTVWRNDGDGNFVDTGQLLDGSKMTPMTALGDLDGDGDLDGVSGNFDGAPNRVLLNNGEGYFTLGQAFDNYSSYDTRLGDVDGDGDLDAIFGNWFWDPNTVWLNDGKGTFADSGQRLGGNVATGGVGLGDFDGDGDLDMVFVQQREIPSQILTNDGSGMFSVTQTLTGTFGLAVDVGDVDGDGDLDFVSAGRGVRLWLNDGAGTFTKSRQAWPETLIACIRLVDIDSNGTLDVFAAGSDLHEPEADWIWLNTAPTVDAYVYLPFVRR